MADYVVRLSGQDNLSGTIKQCKQAVNDFGSAATGAMDKFKARFEKISNSTAPLKRQLKDLKSLMSEMQFKGMANTDEFTKIAQYAGQVKDAMDDASNATRRFADDTFALRAAADAFQVVTGAATALTGAMNLFGVENDEVKKKILQVQSAIAVLNGVQAVANALNKESALMQALKALKMKIVTEYTKLNTVETNKNTIAENANNVSSELGAAAKAKETVAEVANTAATGANTIAQKAWNMVKAIGKALLGDFSGLLLVGAGVLATYAMATDDAAESEENFNNKLDELSSDVLNQITVYEELKSEYDRVKGNAQELSKWINDNSEKFKILKFKVDDARKANLLFGGTEKDFVKASINRSIALAEEAVTAETLGKTIAELSKIYKKFLNGEEVDWADVRKATQRITGRTTKQANQLMLESGFELENDWIYANAGGKDPAAAMSKLMAVIIEEERQKVTTGLQKLRDAMFKQMTSRQQAIYTEQESYIEDEKKPKSPKAPRKTSHKSSSKSSSGGKGSEIELTKEEIDALIKSWDGLNKIIEVAQKKIQNLDKTSKKYNEDLKFYNELILMAQKLKYDLIDQSTIKGLGDAKNQIKTIIDLLPEGSDELAKWKKEETEINKKIAERAAAFINTDSLEGMSKAKQQINDLIKIMDIHSPQIAQLARKWYEVNKAEKEAKQTLDDMMNGIDPNSVAALKKKLQELENERFNIDPTLEGNFLKINNLDYQIEWLKGEIGKRLSMMEGVNVTAPVNFDVTFNYKKKPLEILQEKIDFIQENIDKLSDIKLEDVGDDLFNKAQKDLQQYREMLHDLKREAAMTEMADDIKEYSKTLREDAYEGTKTFVNGLSSMYDAIEGLPDKLDDAKNGMEAFAAITDTIFTVVDSVKAFAEAINSIMEVLELLKGAKAAHAAMSEKETATMLSETFAMNSAAAAEVNKSATDAAAIPVAGALAAANKTLAIETEQLAAAQMFAAHASIPFAGAAIGAAQVGIMEGVLRSLSALSMFAGGGIIGGHSYSGDKLIARVNSGEMILNNRQQRNLFNAINKGELGGANAQTVSFRLKGSDIYGALKNYQKIKGKSGIVTGIQ